MQFYPPFHCEINFIEYFWGPAKRYTREHCEYNFPFLKRLVPAAMDQIPNQLIWKYASCTNRIINAYNTGAIYGSESYKAIISTKYKSHCKVSDLEIYFVFSLLLFLKLNFSIFLVISTLDRLLYHTYFCIHYFAKYQSLLICKLCGLTIPK